jgi:hypothetical protein
MKGKTRCRLHGGASTGPKSPEGKARVVAAMVAGRRAWVEKMEAEGKRFPCGRKPGAAWATPRMKAKQEAEAAKREAERWAALTPQQRFAERHERRRADALRAIEALRERFARTGSLF